MSYSAQNIRNICLLGHGGNGKTSLAESMLYLTGGTARLGKVPDGNTVCAVTRTTVVVRRPSSQGVSGSGDAWTLSPSQAPPVALGGMK